MEAGERRFVAFNVSSQISTKSEAEKAAYFSRLLAADVRPLARYLMTHPIIRRGEPFLTDATFQAKVGALDDFEQWLYTCLKQGVIRSHRKESEPDVFSWLELVHLQNRSRAVKERVYSCYLEFARGAKLNASLFWKRMNQFNTGDSTVRRNDNVRCIEFNSLAQGRSAFETKMGAQLPWFKNAADQQVAAEAARVFDQFTQAPNMQAPNASFDALIALPSLEKLQEMMGAAPASAPAAPSAPAAFDYNSGSSDVDSDMEGDAEESKLNDENCDQMDEFVTSAADVRRHMAKMTLAEEDEHDPQNI
jgi:hypothetical protein